MFSIEAVNCIGACAKAPAMMINERVYGQLDEKKISQVLETLKAEALKADVTKSGEEKQ